MQEVSFFENVLDEAFCRLLFHDSRAKLRSSFEYTKSNFHWDQAVVQASTVVLVRPLPIPFARLVVERLVEKSILPHHDFNVANYAWTRMSYIPWHDDGSKSTAVTLYLNEVWEKDWGGLFLYELAQPGIHGYRPKFNCCVRVVGGISHATTPVSLDAAEPRFTLQIFPNQKAGGE